MTNQPNIFDYATSELSQDAVICWILSFYNDKESKLYSLAKDLLSSFITLSIEDNTIEISKQFYKTDILVHLPKSQRVIILEDKVYTSEHEQISRYVEKISNNDNYKDCKISVVYFKTGFYYDNDKLLEHKYVNTENNKIESFKSIHGQDFLRILKNYTDTDATLDMYIEHLERSIKWYETHGKFYDISGENFWNWNISKQYIAQYNFMRAIFPENKWNKDDKNGIYMLYSGSSSGRPWTEMKILNATDHRIFWRIDIDSKGPYLSLRYYNVYNKKSKEEGNKHTTEYRKYYEYAKKAVDMCCGENKDYYKVGKKENYYEASLLHIHIKDILANWNKEENNFIKQINELTDKFISYTANR